jgi:nitroreductase
MNAATDTLNLIIRHRRSVKPERYTGVPVSDEIINQMLENARWAPTHALTEPWRFFVFKEEGIQKLAAFQANLYKTNTPADQFNEARYEKMLSSPLKASHIILIGMVRQETQKIPVVEEIAAVSCAVQNMMLTATAYGVGSYWSTGGMVYKPEMKTFLGLGEHDQCLGMIYVGNYEGELIESPRKPISEKSTWITEL